MKVSKIISNLSQGVVTNYALYILIGICFYLSIFTIVSIFFDLVNSITVSTIITLICISYYISTKINNSTDTDNLKSSFDIPVIFIVVTVAHLLLGLIVFLITTKDIRKKFSTALCTMIRLFVEFPGLIKNSIPESRRQI